MGQPVDVVVSELHSASARLDDAAQRLQDGMASVNDEMMQLLGSGWRGGAASAYAPVWNQWHDGATKVVEGLQRMSELLNIAGKEYTRTDEQAAGVLDTTVQDSGGSGGNGTGGGPAAASPVDGQGVGRSNDLAQQMNLSRQSSPASGLGDVVQPVTQVLGGLPQQAGQAVAGLTQTAVQLATGLAQQAESEGEDPPTKDDGVEKEAEAELRGAATSGEQAGAAPVGAEPRHEPETQRPLGRPGE